MSISQPSIKVLNLLEPGIYFDIPASQYHALPYPSNSYLGKLDHCPASARVPTKVTRDLVLGRGFHTYTMEPHLFKSEFYVEPQIDARSTIGKRLRGNLILDNLGKEMLTEKEFSEITEMKASVKEHPTARLLLANSYFEVTLIWDHVLPNGSKIRMKARLDGVTKGDLGILWDLKSAKDASQEGFRRAIVQRGYYRQAAIYLDAFKALSRLYYERGLDFPFPAGFDNFTFIAVEKDGVFMTECYDLTMEFYEFGQSEYHRLLEVERSCREAKGGPRYPRYKNAGVTTLDLPQYLRASL